MLHIEQNYIMLFTFTFTNSWPNVTQCSIFFKHSDMVEEMKGEVMELVVTACEKHAANNEVSFMFC